MTESDATKSSRIKKRIAATQQRLAVPQKQPTAVKAKSRKLPARNLDYTPTPEPLPNAVEQAIKDHPFAVLAGGLVVGALVAAMLPKGVVRSAATKAVRSPKAGIASAGLATTVAELALAYGGKLLAAAGDAGKSGRSKLEEVGGTVAKSTAEPRRRASAVAAAVRANAVDAKQTAITSGRRIADAAKGRSSV